MGEDREAELIPCRRAGALLLAMDLALAFLVSRMIGHNESNDYPGVMIYAMAAYTFYAATLAIVNVCRARRHSSPIFSAVKVVNLTAAMVSMLSLEAAMLDRFGDPSLFRQRMLGVSGLVVCVIIVGMSVSLTHPERRGG